MSIDLLILGNAPIERMLERVKLAEDNGYDTVWLADERFYREVYSCLTYFAQHTSRVKVGPCVTDPYARHPALTAMAIATLDEISNQRAILGIGAGISGFAELGIDRKKPARAIREAIELIRMLLRGEKVTYKGEVIQFTDGKLSFAPVRSEIPIYLASNGPIGQKTAGAVADGAIMEACGNVQEVKAFRAVLDAGAKQAGRDPKAVRLMRPVEHLHRGGRQVGARCVAADRGTSARRCQAEVPDCRRAGPSVAAGSGRLGRGRGLRVRFRAVPATASARYRPPRDILYAGGRRRRSDGAGGRTAPRRS